MGEFRKKPAFKKTRVKSESFVDSSTSCRKTIRPTFESTALFSEGLAAVEVSGKVGYINQCGNFVIEPKFAYGGDFSEGVAVVVPFKDTAKGAVRPKLLLWETPSCSQYKNVPLNWELAQPFSD